MQQAAACVRVLYSGAMRNMCCGGLGLPAGCSLSLQLLSQAPHLLHLSLERLFPVAQPLHLSLHALQPPLQRLELLGACRQCVGRLQADCDHCLLLGVRRTLELTAQTPRLTLTHLTLIFGLALPLLAATVT